MLSVYLEGLVLLSAQSDRASGLPTKVLASKFSSAVSACYGIDRKSVVRFHELSVKVIRE